MKVIKVVCLPKAGIENPYQMLMMLGLSSNKNLRVRHGIDSKLFGIITSALLYKPDYLHFDWLHRYYYRKSILFQYLQIPLFIAEVIIVRYVLKVKIVWTLHNIQPHDSKNIAIQRLCRSFFAKHCVWIRIFSELTIERASEYLRIPQDKFKVLPEGSYIECYPNSITTTQARKQLLLPIETRVYLILGLIKPYKGISEFLDFFNSVKEENEHLIIAGKVMDDNYGHLLKSKVNNQVTLVDRFIKEDQLQIYYNAADLVVLPFNKIENSGSAIMAMGFSKAILAPRIGVLKGRLREYNFLYERNFEEGWARQKYYSSDELNEIGLKNFKQLQQYKWKDFARFFIEHT